MHWGAVAKPDHCATNAAAYIAAHGTADRAALAAAHAAAHTAAHTAANPGADHLGPDTDTDVEPVPVAGHHLAHCTFTHRPPNHGANFR